MNNIDNLPFNAFQFIDWLIIEIIGLTLSRTYFIINNLVTRSTQIQTIQIILFLSV